MTHWMPDWIRPKQGCREKARAPRMAQKAIAKVQANSGGLVPISKMVLQARMSKRTLMNLIRKDTAHH